MKSPVVRRRAAARLLAFAECAARDSMLLLVHCFYPFSSRILPIGHLYFKYRLLLGIVLIHSACYCIYHRCCGLVMASAVLAYVTLAAQTFAGLGSRPNLG